MSKFKVRVYNKIAESGISKLTQFCNVSTDSPDPEAIVLRSHKLHGMTINPELLAIGRAGAGVNNIPVDHCTDDAVVVFNAPGANANAVKELVFMGMLLSSRDVLGGLNFVKSLPVDSALGEQVEKNKSRFGGEELQGKSLGVIGLGAIGSMVANTAVDFGLKVYGLDPFISINWAWSLSPQVRRVESIKALLKKVDYISLHVPSTPDTKAFFNASIMADMKPGTVVLNFARPDIVDESDMADALNNNRIKQYLTDFPSETLVENPSVVSIPHLGASTREAEENCAIMIANQMEDFLKLGNITNSVNYPTCALEPSGKNRLAITNDNIPNIIGQVTSILANHGLNISEMVNKSRGNIAYTLIDLDGDLSASLVNEITALTGVKRVRLLSLID
ncbi:3-phosphoglycerate dehydrogenase [bacterium]|nr:3-phosphoglycerate dehydrogenase [bacterium]|tara:strand:- start:1909 stop:3084 length:1176 start_codon:yes stop_codon:yes gene_type:complete